MALSNSVVPWALAVLALTALWKLLKRFVVKSPLDNIPGPPPQSWTKGNVAQIFNRDSWPMLDNLTDDYQQVVKLNGIFGQRSLWVFDPKALNHILLKDQEVYEEGEMSMIFRRLSFGPGLFATSGEHHRRQRKLLNPVFSIAHMRNLTPIFYETAHRLSEGVKIQLKTTDTNEVDILAWMGRTALELIGRGGLGHSFDPLVRSEPVAYADALKQFIPTSARVFSWRFVAPIYAPLLKLGDKYPFVKRMLTHVIPWVPHPALHELKTLIDTLDVTSREIYAQKKRALISGDEDVKLGMDEGRDLMSVLLRANTEAAEEDRLPEEEIIAQMSSLTFAGTDTTSNALARILHLLSTRPEVQEKLRREIIEAQSANGGHDLPYDDLVELPYLDAVCRETMRLYPPVAFMTREAARDMVLPVSNPVIGKDGTSMTSIPIPKGQTIFIGIHSSNRNKAIWGEDAKEWKPERWLGDGVPESVTAAHIPGVYANLMTFLGGGRACIGFKFSQLEMKVVLSMLLVSFRFSLADGEDTNIKWNRAGVAYPSVAKSHGKPSMPLKLEVV